MTFNKFKPHEVLERNTFFACIQQGSDYFLVDLQSGNSVPINDCDDLDDAVEKFGDALQALETQGKAKKGKLVPGEAPHQS